MPTTSPHVCVYLKENERQLFTREARKRGLTRSGLIKLAVTDYLQRNKFVSISDL